MYLVELSHCAIQEGYGDPDVELYWLRKNQGALLLELSRHFNICLEPVPDPEIDPDLMEDEDPWYEDPSIVWGGDAEIGLVYD